MKYFWIVISCLFFFSVEAFAQIRRSHQPAKTEYINGYKVSRGYRPAIDLTQVPKDSYYPGRIQVKLKPQMHKSMDAELMVAGKDGFVKTGVDAIDKVNRQIGAVEYLRRQDALYRVSEASRKHRDRHEAWGSHLWREITFDSKFDVLEAISLFEKLEEVEIVEPVFIIRRVEPVDIKPIINENGGKWTPNDPLYVGNQWHFENYGQTVGGQAGVAGWDVNAEAAWDIEKGNPNFIVAIIDGGVQYNHPDLDANMWWPLLGPEGTSTRPDDHGTHVGGTVAAVTNNAVGVAGLAGGDGTPNTGVKLMTIDLFDGTHGLSTLGMNQYAADNGASISQNSWGYENPNVIVQSDLDGIDYFNANGGGAGLIGGITIFAAGNDNDDRNWYPAYYGFGDPATMGAMAVASYDNRGVKSSFSNYGAWIDITAPGTNVASTATAGGYLFMGGTSMACPHVSGVAAMIVSNTEGVLTNQELWDILVASVRTDLYTVNPGYIGELGSGALDAAAALVEAQTYLGGVPRPNNFVATATGTNQVALSWDLNEENDDVLVAWALDGNPIGQPVNGTTYAVGNTLPGGGTVLYVGGATSVNHTGLAGATTYAYKVFAIALDERQDNQGEWYQLGDYSNARNASATTECPVYTPPFAEGFEGGSIPLCWSQQYHTGTTNWAILSGAAQSGTYSVRFNGAAGGQSTRLVTPQISFLGYSEAILTFWERRPQDGSGGNARRDELRVEYWNGSAWVEVSSYTATQATWIQRTVTLPPAALIEEGMIAFRAVASTRILTTTHVDNITITASGSVIYSNFSATPLTVDIDQTVTFTDSSGGGVIASWDWDFGAGADPATATGQGPHEVTYSTAGQKTVALTVNGTTTTTKTNYINVNRNHILAPRNLDYVLTGNDVSLEWLTPLIDDGWETYTNFALGFGNWTQHDLDGFPSYGIVDVTFTNQNYIGSFIVFNPSQTSPPLMGAWLPNTGSKYAACFNATTPPNNDWLISPAVSIENGHSLSFYHKTVVGTWGLERFRVGISTTGTNPGDFTIISAGAYQESPLAWTEFTYDLSAYAGQEIHIGIHCVSNDAFAFFVDDFIVSDGSGKAVFAMFDEEEDAGEVSLLEEGEAIYRKVKQEGESVVANFASKSYAGYNVYRDGVEVGNISGEKTLAFEDQALLPGIYKYTVKATYIAPANESGPSNEVEVVVGKQWTGLTDTDWFTNTNWHGGIVPASVQGVLIAPGVPNFPVISGSTAEVSDLVILDGATVHLDVDGALTVSGTLINQGGNNGLVINSDATGTGSLINGTSEVGATAQRHIARNGWHFLSSPVSGMDIIGSDFVPDENPLPTNFDFYFFDETAAQVGGTWYPWINVRGAGGVPNTARFDQFVPGRGYLVAYRAGYVVDNPLEFGGTLHSGEVGIEITNSSTSNAIKGWNLLGNPYPSAINWATVDKSQFEDNYAYIYDPTYGGGGGYQAVSGVVAPHQGFFVEVKPAAHEDDFTFTNALRVHGGSYLKNETQDSKNETQDSRLILRLTRQSNSFYDQATLQLADGSLLERDPQDAQKLWSFNAAMPQLFSLTADQKFVAINSIPFIAQAMVQPLGVYTPANGQYSLEMVEATGDFANRQVTLQDVDAGQSNLMLFGQPYTFSSSPGTSTERFKLVFSQPTGVEDMAEDEPAIYVWDNNLHINFGAEAGNRQLKIFDTSGRQIMGKELGQGTNYIVPLNLQAGIYVVQVASTSGVVVRRVFVR